MRALALVFVCAAGCARSPADGAPFVAEDSDFAGYTSWYSTPLTDDTGLSDVVYPAGARVGFLNHRPPAGASAYPEGTVVVKAIERGSGPPEWEIFGMAKRGGGYDADGAVGWEFFLLLADTDGTLHIVSRGLAPMDDGHAGDMGMASGTYFENGQIVPCNVCHGLARFAGTDHLISNELAPDKTAP
jgi:hypothetical protein